MQQTSQEGFIGEGVYKWLSKSGDGKGAGWESEGFRKVMAHTHRENMWPVKTVERCHI